jgi:hypothetical protein
MMGVPAHRPHFLANGTAEIPNRDFSGAFAAGAMVIAGQLNAAMGSCEMVTIPALASIAFSEGSSAATGST